jgi:hypothetical protein
MVMSNNKQTSVEQLFHKLWKTPIDKFTWYAILEEHMAIHKEEIIDAHGEQYDYSYSQIDPTKITGEQYYEQTFGGDK